MGKIASFPTQSSFQDHLDGLSNQGKIDATREWDAAFNLFWSKSTRRGGKAAARRAWHKHRPTKVEEMKERFRLIWTLYHHRIKHEWSENTMYRPHISTWLNAEEFDREEVEAITAGTD
jgi:hypothetical protein